MQIDWNLVFLLRGRLRPVADAHHPTVDSQPARRGLVAMQSPTPHSVALAYDGSDLYFFDPNSGVHELTNLASAATELENHLTTRYAVPFCVHANMFKLNH